MFWSKHGNLFFVTVGGDRGTWRLFGEQEAPWKEGMPEKSCETQPPPGMQQPLRGFGGVWCANQKVREQLGWAVDAERGFANGIDLIQGFIGGVIVRDSDGRTKGLAYVMFWDDRTFVRDTI